MEQYTRGVQRIFFSITIIFTMLIIACSSGLPSGWRLPTNEELRDTWRDESDSRYATVKGDFNGDGIIDEAKLLLRKDGNALGLFVFLSQKDGAFKIFQLDEINAVEYIQVMGIEKVERGTYKTACGKGYWDCQDDEPSEIILHNDAIDYYKIQSVNSFFYWDKGANSFKRIWISD
jgi:hypothetical protein